MTGPGRGAASLLLLILLVAAPAVVRAQRPQASPFVEPGHWAIDAARRLHVAGVMPRGYDPAVEPPTYTQLLEAFDSAASGSPLGGAFLARLEEEVAGLDLATRTAAGADALAMGRFRVGLHSTDGRVRLGSGNADDWSGPLPLREPDGAVASGELLARTGPVAAAVRGSLTEGGLRLGWSHVAAAVGPLAVWAGHGGLRFGTSPSGGIVSSQTPPRPGVGIQFVRPVALPWLGWFRLSTALNRMDRNHTFDHPWLWRSRLFLSPHRRLDLGINRGVMFGGSGNSRLSLENLAYILIGKHTGGFDNQVVSVSTAYRPPLRVPLELHLVWGMEDSAGAWRDVPGVVAGVDLAAVPGAPEVALGISGAWFAESCCGNPIWYQNFAFRGGWADDGALLGHPLGGHGRELQAHARTDVIDARLQVRGSVFGRDRGAENVFAPAREGRSAGLRVGVLGFLAGWQIGLDVLGETGLADRNWTETRLDVGIRGTF